MLPKLLGEIFANDPWFEAEALGATTPDQARQWRLLLHDQLDRTRVREVFRRCIKSALLYGNGIMKISWVLREREHLEWLPKMQQNVQNGRVTGFRRVLDKQTKRKIENRPQLEYVSLTDFYIDPNCFSPQVTDARYVIQRKLVSVDDLIAMRPLKEYKIPADDARLFEWARNKPAVQGDNTKSSAELYRMGFWQPTIDQSVDPSAARIEILEYQTDNRFVLVANREHAILNIPNSYGFKTFYDVFYADVLDRFYALGICDVVEGEQRLQVALLCGRLDEVSVSLHRPLVKKMGVKVPQSQNRVKPGQQWEAENPKDDFVFLDIPNITASAYLETQASELRVQKTTGVTDLAVLGTPSSGGNSAARTATGVGVQAQASSSRLKYIVENIEDTFIEPMLNDLVKLNQMFPPIGSTLGDTVALSRVSLSMRASAKMQSRMALLQTFPLIFQTMANPALVAEMAIEGKALDWEELFRVLTDMTGYRSRGSFIRQLSQEEMKARQQPPPEEMLRMQMQRERIEGQERIQGQKLESQSQSEREKQYSADQTDDNYAMIELAKAIMAASKNGEDR